MQPSHSTVIFVQSTAHWEAIQKQRAQLVGVNTPTTPIIEPSPPRIIIDRKPSSTKNKTSRLIGKEGSRRRNRWTNNTFSDHPLAVLYPEDLRPPGYEAKAPKYDIGLISSYEYQEEAFLQSQVQKAPHYLSRHVGRDLKKAHISVGLITYYESQLIQFIDIWLSDTQCLENVCLKIHVVSNNQFERYVLHAMSQYYGFSSFSKTNEQDQRLTYICHPAYVKYVTKRHTDINYSQIQGWLMPEQSFYEYLFHPMQ